MTSLAIGRDGPWGRSASKRALNAAAAAWFAVMLLGQWLFVCYIAIYFGGNLVLNGLPGLAQTHAGYVAGDFAGNFIIAGHVMVAILIHGCGPLQLMPQIRRRFPVFHRYTGRAFLAAAFLGALSGLYMVWVRGSKDVLLGDISNTVNTILIFTFGVLALRYAMARNIATHRRWALRLFMAASAVWFLRLGVYGSALIIERAGGDFSGVAAEIFGIMHIAKIAAPLCVLEIYSQAQDRGGLMAHYGAAAMLVLAAGVTGMGVYAVATLGWLPRVMSVL